VGVGIGFILYLFCKKEDRWKRWKRFNKVNPLKRMRHRMFSEGASVFNFLRKKRIRRFGGGETVATLGT
jgi:hypothetical protein